MSRCNRPKIYATPSVDSSSYAFSSESILSSRANGTTMTYIDTDYVHVVSISVAPVLPPRGNNIAWELFFSFSFLFTPAARCKIPRVVGTVSMSVHCGGALAKRPSDPRGTRLGSRKTAETNILQLTRWRHSIWLAAAAVTWPEHNRLSNHTAVFSRGRRASSSGSP